MTDQWEPPGEPGRQSGSTGPSGDAGQAEGAGQAEDARQAELTARMQQRVAARRADGAPRRGVGRTVARGAGELMITLGAVLLLLVVYELYITNIFSAQKQAAATEVLDEQWAEAATAEVTVTAPAPPGSQSAEPSSPSSASEESAAAGATADPAERTRRYDTSTGAGFAKLYIPAFGDYVQTVIEGTNDDDLYIGPGHYPDTQYPGEQGNFAVAGHRVSKGSPFNDLDLLKSCDSLVVETQDDWFVYRVMPMQDEVSNWDPAGRAHCDGVDKPTGAYAGVVGRSIVLPSAREVIHPVPGSTTIEVPENAERLITLTTCHPQFSDAERMIVHGVLVKTYPKKANFTPPELAEQD